MRAPAAVFVVSTVLVPRFALCQPTAARPAFDIADVHLSPRAEWAKTVDNWTDGGYLAGDRYELRRATLLDLIATAYNVDADKIHGGPSWIDYDRFEVVGKTKPGTRAATLRAMLQTLLADRFHLVLKTESQPVPGYFLKTGKGDLKISAAADSSNPSGCQNTQRLEAGRMYNNVQCHNVTMEQYAATLRGWVGRLPVIDATGLDGGWDFEEHFAAATPMSASEDATAAERLDKLGLKLEPGNVPQPVLTVESVNEQPSPNPPGLAAALPPLPAPQFEVASIRRCEPNTASHVPEFSPGGRVNATCMSAAFLIDWAWKMAPDQHPVGIPKGLLNAPDITIVAKAPGSMAPEFAWQARDTLNAMMRALLTDRYKMTFHYEDRPMDAYTLVASKPKLTKADPANRTGCARQNDIHPGQGAAVHLDCRNMTMAQFAEQIPVYHVDIAYPVLDGTGIDGAWDFTLTYDVLSHRPGRGGPTADAATAATGEAPDPSGATLFVEAIQRQLGLKLEVHKRPEPVLVIDHMEEKPTEN